jgi:hypothetical protein
VSSWATGYAKASHLYRISEPVIVASRGGRPHHNYASTTDATSNVMNKEVLLVRMRGSDFGVASRSN